MHERPVQLDGLVRDVLQGLEMAVKDRDIQWRIEPLPTVSGDPPALRQVLANLIGNAVKYTGRRETAEIRIGSKPGDDGMITVFVRDNGAGFDMAYAGKLFGVFQRLHRTDEFEGTGIGLASVRRMIARHGGRTWAEGAVDQGATFYFTLKPAPTGNA
jgi:light-regulated signal transduction histidine kinase (bacteriophytochrome)